MLGVKLAVRLSVAPSQTEDQTFSPPVLHTARILSQLLSPGTKCSSTGLNAAVTPFFVLFG